jgi:hypothetical protein
MQNVAGGEASIQSDQPGYRSIVSELASLIEHVQASTKLIESAIAGEASPDNLENSSNVAVLDDVTPRYIRASAALNACNAKLGAALRCLLNAGISRQAADGA